MKLYRHAWMMNLRAHHLQMRPGCLQGRLIFFWVKLHSTWIWRRRQAPKQIHWKLKYTHTKCSQFISICILLWQYLPANLVVTNPTVLCRIRCCYKLDSAGSTALCVMCGQAPKFFVVASSVILQNTVPVAPARMTEAWRSGIKTYDYRGPWACPSGW